jgi:hypothetical protein
LELEQKPSNILYHYRLAATILYFRQQRFQIERDLYGFLLFGDVPIKAFNRDDESHKLRMEIGKY